MYPKSALLNVMTQAAQKAARGLIRDFGEVEHLQVSKKVLVILFRLQILILRAH